MYVLWIPDFLNSFHLGGRSFQQFVDDMYAKVEVQQLLFEDEPV